MIKKRHTIYCIGGLILGTVGGIAGTAFSMGADKQRINDTLIRHTTEMVALRTDDAAHEKATQQELDRFTIIISEQMTQIQTEILHLADTIGNLRTDVQVLKAIMERMEKG